MTDAPSTGRLVKLLVLLVVLLAIAILSIGFRDQLSASLHQWPIDETAVYVGPLDNPSIEQVIADENPDNFQPLQESFSAGYSRRVYWFRLLIESPPEDVFEQRTLVLTARPPFLKSLILFWTHQDLEQAPPDAPSIEIYENGNQVPFSERPYIDRNLAFPLFFTEQGSQYFYLRLETTTSAFLELEAWTRDGFYQKQTIDSILIGGYIGLVLAGLLSAVWQRGWHRDPMQRSFVVFLVLMLVHFLNSNGLIAQFFFPERPELAGIGLMVMAYLVSAALILLLFHSLDLSKGPAWIRWLYRITFWYALLMSPAPLLGFHSEANGLLVSLGTLSLLVGTGLALVRLVKRQSTNLWLLAASLFPLIGSLVSSLTLLGILPGDFLLYSGFQLGLIGSLVAFQVLIAERRNQLESNYEDARREARLASARADWEHQRADEQQRFMDMLTHELKTPLSLLRLSMKATHPSAEMRRHADRAVIDMDAIIERCALVSRIQEETLADRREWVELGSCLSLVIDSLPDSARIQSDWYSNSANLQCLTDPLLLRTVLFNLFENALKYSNEGEVLEPRMSRSLKADREGFHIQLCNTIGAAGAPDPERIFDKYYRAPGASRFSGSGLGLFIVKELIIRLGGDIQCMLIGDDKREICFKLWIPKEFPNQSAH